MGALVRPLLAICDSVGPPHKKSCVIAKISVTFVTSVDGGPLPSSMFRSHRQTHHRFRHSDTSERAPIAESVPNKIKTRRSNIGAVTTHFSKIARTALHLSGVVLLVQLDGHFIGSAEASVVTGTAGDVYSWGRSYMLGINETNTTAKTTVPEPIKDPANPASDWPQDFVSVGSDSQSLTTCGVTSDGTGYCWGSSFYGQVGSGTTDYSYFPVEVAGNHTWKMIAPGASHVCGVRTDDVAMCWGYNNHGQLGDGTTTDSTTPVVVSGGIAFASIDGCLLYTSPSPRDLSTSRMPSSA